MAGSSAIRGLGSIMTAGRVTLLACIVLAIVAAIVIAQRPPSDFSVPDNRAALDEFLAGPRRTGPREAVYAGAGGAELGFLGYLAQRSQPRVALVYLHGIASHAGWFDRAARLLQGEGLDVFCLDRRGSGINREDRGLPSGHTESMHELFADIDAFVAPLAHRYDRIVLVGLSWGGKLALAYSLSRPDSAHDLVLITPGIRALVDVSTAEKLGIFVASFVAPRTYFATPIEPILFTTTPEHLAYIREDPLRLRAATARFFMTSRALDGYVDRRVAKTRLPVLLYLAGGDRIIDNTGVVEVLEKSPAPVEILEYEDQTHSIQFDAPERMVEDMVRWMERRTRTGSDKDGRGRLQNAGATEPTKS